MIVLTGGAGFIGSCILARLNASGRRDIIVVDHLNDLKEKNIQGKSYKAYYDKKEFLKLILSDGIKGDIEAVIHMGACSSTVLQDKAYFDENNFQYSCHVADWSLKRGAKLIYASSAATYGDGHKGYDDNEALLKGLKPLNLYGASKQMFDEWVLGKKYFDRFVGLKFFNVYGPNEYHKADMRSVAAKAFSRIVAEGTIELFRSYQPQYRDGEQKRDFIYVKDAVEIVVYFLENPRIAGLFNVGTGEARSWNDLALALFQAVGKKSSIRYIEMPKTIRENYQYFTQANMSKLRQAGYHRPMTSLEEGIKDYSEYLSRQAYY